MDEQTLIRKLMSATGKKELYNVAEEAIKIPFENNDMNVQYRKMDASLQAHAGHVDPEQFTVDAVQIQPLGGGSGYRVQVNGSFYTRVKKADNEFHASAHKAGGPGRVVVTTTGKVDLYCKPDKIDGEGLVMFEEGHQ